MRSLSEALQDTLQPNSFLHYGLSQGVLNLTKTATLLQPILESTLQKPISVSAITMQLSREQQRLDRYVSSFNTVQLDSVSIISNLSLLSFDKSGDTLIAAKDFNTILQEQGESLTMTQSMSEITIIFPTALFTTAKELFGQTPKYTKEELAGITVSFDHAYTQRHGLIFTLIQAIELQAINIVEIASTHTELIFYVEKSDAKAVFSTFHDTFCR